eukprot:403344344
MLILLSVFILLALERNSQLQMSGDRNAKNTSVYNNQQERSNNNSGNWIINSATQNNARKEKSHLAHKIIGMFLLIFTKLLYLPVIDILVNLVVNSYLQITNKNKSFISVLSMNIVSIFLYLMILYSLKKFFKLTMTSSNLQQNHWAGEAIGCWGEPDTKFQYFDLLSKIMMPVFLGLQISTDSILLQEFLVFAVQLINLIVMIISSHRILQFDKFLRYIQLGTQSTVVFALLISIIKYFVDSYDNREGIIFVVFLPFNVYSAISLSNWYSQRILNKYKHEELQQIDQIKRNNQGAYYQSQMNDMHQSGNQPSASKLKQFEYETVFMMLNELAYSCLNNSNQSKGNALQQLYANNSFQQLLEIVECHATYCLEVLLVMISMMSLLIKQDQIINNRNQEITQKQKNNQ